jgi:hypothetical protein
LVIKTFKKKPKVKRIGKTRLLNSRLQNQKRQRFSEQKFVEVKFTNRECFLQVLELNLRILKP